MSNAISTVSFQTSTIELCCEVRQNFHALGQLIEKVGTPDEKGLVLALNPIVSDAYKNVIMGYVDRTDAAKDMAAAARCLVIGAGSTYGTGSENRKTWNKLCRSNARLEMQIDRDSRA